MIDIIRSEWIKLRTITVTWVLVIVAAAFPLVVTLLTAIFASEPETVSDGDLAGLVTGTAIVSAMLLGVVAAIGITNEFAHGTIRPTFAAAPDRIRVLVAKPVVDAALAVVVMTIVLSAAWIIGSVLLDQRTDGTLERPPSDDAVLPAFIGTVLLAVGLSLLGYGLGLLIRNSAATVSILLLWPLVAEGIVAGIFVLIGIDSAVRFLPYSAGFNMAVTEPDPDSFGRVAGGLYFGAWVIAIAIFGIVSSRRRDA